MDPTPASERPSAPGRPTQRIKLDAETAGAGVGVAAIGVCCATAVAGPGLGVALAGVLAGLAWCAPLLAIAVAAGVVLLLGRGHSGRVARRVRRRARQRPTAAGSQHRGISQVRDPGR